MDNPKDILSARLHQVSAMLNVAYGGGIESFDELSTEIKDYYLYAMSTLLDEAIEADKQI
jgi:hypothetical protein